MSLQKHGFLSSACLNRRKRCPEALFFLFEGMDGYSGSDGDVRTGLKLKSGTKAINLLGKVSAQITEPVHPMAVAIVVVDMARESGQRPPRQRPALQNTLLLRK